MNSFVNRIMNVRFSVISLTLCVGLFSNACSKRDQVYYSTNFRAANEKANECKDALEAAAATRNTTEFKRVMSDEECRWANSAVVARKQEEAKKEELAEESKRTEEKIRADQAIAQLKLLGESELEKQESQARASFNFEKSRQISEARQGLYEDLLKELKSDSLKMDQVYEQCQKEKIGKSLEEKRTISSTNKCNVAENLHRQAESQRELAARKKKEEESEERVKKLVALSVSEFEAIIAADYKKNANYLEYETREAFKRRLEIYTAALKGQNEKIKSMFNDCVARNNSSNQARKYQESYLIKNSFTCMLAVEAAKQELGYKGWSLPDQPL